MLNVQQWKENLMNDIDQNTLDHHIGHATAQLKGQHNVNNQFVTRLLNDALGAIAIDHPEIAVKRINAAIRNLKASK